MAIGDVTISKVGVYTDQTIGAVTAMLSGAYLSGTKLVYVPMNNGQIIILKEVVTGW
jgi:hypothetical protein